jgi:hypothetical protein
MLPKPKPIDGQLRLFDEPLTRLPNQSNHAIARNVLGSFVEDLTAQLFNGTRLQTDSRCPYYPDIALTCRISPTRWSNIYLECKSAGLSNQTFIYKGRLEKDWTFAQDHKLIYVIWHHSAYVGRAETFNELKALFLSKIKAVYLVPFESIDEICSSLRLEKLNTKYGHKPGLAGEAYGSGYRFPIKAIEKVTHQRIEWNIKWPKS